MAPFSDWLTPLGRVADRCARNEAGPRGNWLTRAVLLRLLGLVYTMAFLTLAQQGPALLGPRGLLPIRTYLDEVAAQAGSRAQGFWLLPSVFWWASSDGGDRGGRAGPASPLGLVVVAGYANAIVLALLCALQISIVNVGQTFYGFGWEIQLVETGFLCIFLVPLVDPRPFPAPAAADHRDLAAPLAVGADHVGRGPHQAARRSLLARPDLPRLSLRDPADPEPADPATFMRCRTGRTRWASRSTTSSSWSRRFFVLRHAPDAAARGRRDAGAAGHPDPQRQLVVPQLADDRSDPRVLRRRRLGRLLPRGDSPARRGRGDAAEPSRAQGDHDGGLGVAIALLSVPPLLNLLSGQQVMNTSFTRLPLVNTYGAFGSVGRERNQLVFEGTTDDAVTDTTRLARVRLQVSAGRPGPPPLLDEPVPLSARLAALVRGHGQPA